MSCTANSGISILSVEYRTIIEGLEDGELCTETTHEQLELVWQRITPSNEQEQIEAATVFVEGEIPGSKVVSVSVRPANVMMGPRYGPMRYDPETGGEIGIW